MWINSPVCCNSVLKNKQRSGSGKRSNRRGSRRNASHNKGTAGDIPRQRKVDIMTLSTRVPSSTPVFTTRCALSPIILVASASATQSSSINANFNNTDNVANFQTIFDQYRIVAMRVNIIPQNNAIRLVTNSTTSLVDFYTVIDYDNPTALSNAAAARDYENCMIQAPGESAMRVFQPRMALAAYAGAFTSYANTQPLWIDCASPSVQHYGLKYFIPQATAAQTQLQSWELNAEYFIQFRSVI